MRKYLIASIVLMMSTFAGLTCVNAQSDAPTLRIVTEDPNLPSDLFYGNVRVKPLRLRPGTNVPITINDADFFVQNQYIDFLNRFPDPPGFAHWVGNIITVCGNDALCIDRQRTNTSAAFFLSPEFQYTGYYVYRLYKGGLGRLPFYAELMPETRQVAKGIVVNNQLSASIIEANRLSFTNDFVKRGDFIQRYPDTQTPQQYVDALFATTGINASADDRAALVTGLTNKTETRATVLKKVVDGTHVIAEGQQEFLTSYGKAFYDQEFNRAFVLMEYFGYLRRDPDTAGFNFWLNKLNYYGNYVDAEMVRSFIISPEYLNRF